MIRIQMLGPLDVMVVSRPAGERAPRQHRVLARQVAGGGGAVSVDRLIENLYSGEKPHLGEKPQRAPAAAELRVSRDKQIKSREKQIQKKAMLSTPRFALLALRWVVDPWRNQ